MKKVFFSLIVAMMFIGCTTSTSVNKLHEKIIASSFMDLKLLFKADNPYSSEENELGEYYVYFYVDRNTDVLYMRETSFKRASITPIMKADGSCLTYTEWKEKVETICDIRE